MKRFLSSIRIKRKKTAALAAVLLVLATGCLEPAVTGVPMAPAPSGSLDVVFLDVGQGLSVFVQDTQGNELLYDGGNNNDGPLVVDYLESRGVDDLEYLVGSHPHEDHIGGLDDVIRAFDVERALIAQTDYDTVTYNEVIAALADGAVAVDRPSAGARYPFGEGFIEVLGPAGASYDETNGYSLVLKITYGDASVLLTGDVEAEGEHEMLDSGVDLDVDILQVPHHGAATSTTARFLYEADPVYGVISVGEDNNYGHPDKIILDRLAHHGVKVMRTDVDGTVVFTLDKEGIAVNGEREAATQVAEADTGTTDPYAVVIKEVDKRAEIVTLMNTGSHRVHLAGWTLLSAVGDQAFTFPAGAVLEPGEVLTVVSGWPGERPEGDYTMAEEPIWNNSRKDPAVLFAPDGTEVYRVE